MKQRFAEIFQSKTRDEWVRAPDGARMGPWGPCGRCPKPSEIRGDV